MEQNTELDQAIYNFIAIISQKISFTSIEQEASCLKNIFNEYLNNPRKFKDNKPTKSRQKNCYSDEPTESNGKKTYLNKLREGYQKMWALLHNMRQTCSFAVEQSPDFCIEIIQKVIQIQKTAVDIGLNCLEIFSKDKQLAPVEYPIDLMSEILVHLKDIWECYANIFFIRLHKRQPDSALQLLKEINDFLEDLESKLTKISSTKTSFQLINNLTTNILKLYYAKITREILLANKQKDDRQQIGIYEKQYEKQIAEINSIRIKIMKMRARDCFVREKTCEKLKPFRVVSNAGKLWFTSSDPSKTLNYRGKDHVYLPNENGESTPILNSNIELLFRTVIAVKAISECPISELIESEPVWQTVADDIDLCCNIKADYDALPDEPPPLELLTLMASTTNKITNATSEEALQTIRKIMPEIVKPNTIEQATPEDLERIFSHAADFIYKIISRTIKEKAINIVIPNTIVLMLLAYINHLDGEINKKLANAPEDSNNINQHKATNRTMILKLLESFLQYVTSYWSTPENANEAVGSNNAKATTQQNQPNTETAEQPKKKKKKKKKKKGAESQNQVKTPDAEITDTAKDQQQEVINDNTPKEESLAGKKTTDEIEEPSPREEPRIPTETILEGYAKKEETNELDTTKDSTAEESAVTTLLSLKQEPKTLIKEKKPTSTKKQRKQKRKELRKLAEKTENVSTEPEIPASLPTPENETSKCSISANNEPEKKPDDIQESTNITEPDEKPKTETLSVHKEEESEQKPSAEEKQIKRLAREKPADPLPEPSQIEEKQEPENKQFAFDPKTPSYQPSYFKQPDNKFFLNKINSFIATFLQQFPAIESFMREHNLVLVGGAIPIIVRSNLENTQLFIPGVASQLPYKKGYCRTPSDLDFIYQGDLAELAERIPGNKEFSHDGKTLYCNLGKTLVNICRYDTTIEEKISGADFNLAGFAYDLERKLVCQNEDETINLYSGVLKGKKDPIEIFSKKPQCVMRLFKYMSRATEIDKGLTPFINAEHTVNDQQEIGAFSAKSLFFVLDQLLFLGNGANNYFNLTAAGLFKTFFSFVKQDVNSSPKKLEVIKFLEEQSLGNRSLLICNALAFIDRKILQYCSYSDFNPVDFRTSIKKQNLFILFYLALFHEVFGQHLEAEKNKLNLDDYTREVFRCLQGLKDVIIFPLPNDKRAPFNTQLQVCIESLTGIKSAPKSVVYEFIAIKQQTEAAAAYNSQYLTPHSQS